MENLKPKHIKGKSIRNIDLESLSTYLVKHKLNPILITYGLMVVATCILLYSMGNHRTGTNMDFVSNVVGTLFLLVLLYNMIVLEVDLFLIISPLLLSKKSHAYATIVDTSNPYNIVIEIDTIKYTLETTNTFTAPLNLHDGQDIIIYSLQSGLNIYQYKNQS